VAVVHDELDVDLDGRRLVEREAQRALLVLAVVGVRVVGRELRRVEAQRGKDGRRDGWRARWRRGRRWRGGGGGGRGGGGRQGGAGASKAPRSGWAMPSQSWSTARGAPVTSVSPGRTSDGSPLSNSGDVDCRCRSPSSSSAYCGAASMFVPEPGAGTPVPLEV